MKFQEVINVEKAKYLYSLSDSYWSTAIFSNEEENEDGNKYTQKDYIANCKKWLSKGIKKKGTLKTDYKFSKYMLDKGRIYVKVFGIQSLQRDLRGFLCSDDYVDIDMKNAHNNILFFIKNKFFQDIKCPALGGYVNNRDKILSSFNITKVDVLKILNQEWKYKGDNKFLKSVDAEFKALQTAIWNSDHFIGVPKSNLKASNKKGSFINRVLCVYENLILQEAIEKVGCDVPMFDGMFIRKKEGVSIDDVLEKLNNNIYNIEWTRKPHSDKIKIDADLVVPDYEDEYTVMKKEFEKQYFFTRCPVSFVALDGEDIEFYKKPDFQIITAPWVYEDDGKTKPFFNEWLKDSTRKQYKRIDFIPDLDKCPEDVYNMFKPFTAEYIEPEKRIDTTLFYELIDLLVNHRDDCKDYLLSYISDMFQNPAKSPTTGILFKGIEGAGKDMMINFLKNIMGNDYSLDVPHLEHILGKFNSSMSRKLLLNISEVEGKDAYNKDNPLKFFLTALKHRIEKKGVDPWEETNYKRVFGTTNGDNSLKLSTNNRRWTVFQTASPREKAFYSELGPNLENQEFLNSLYSEFMDYEIKITVSDIMNTEEMNEMESLNINPFYLFSYEFFRNKRVLDGKYKKYLYFDKKENNVVYIRNNHFVQEMFEPWLLDETDYGCNYLEKVNYRKLKMHLSKIGIPQVSMRIDNKIYRTYKVDLGSDFKLLKDYYDWDKYKSQEVLIVQ